jgi:cell wall-associated NlpC family hydrolase
MALGRAGGATVKLSVDDQQFARDLVRDEARFKRSTSNMNADIGKLSRGALAGTGVFGGFARSIAFASTAFLGGAGLGYAVRTAFTELSDATKVAAQTNAVLKSTGAIAGVTSKNVEELGKSLMQLSGVDDEMIKSGENMLLTFTNIRNVSGENNDIFNQATKILLDMNTALGKTGEGTGNLNHTAIQLGKALNDPIKGITALRRVGVNFNETQIETIKKLVESNHVLEAQKLILHELQIEFGGSAKAAGATFPGQISRLRETMKNLSATLLRDLIPQIEKITQRLLKWLDNTKNQQRVQEDFRKVIRAVSQALSAARQIFDLLVPVVRAVTKAVGGAENAFKLLLALAIVAKLRAIAVALRLVGTSAATAGGKAGVGGLLSRLGILSRLGPITIGIVIAYSIVKKGSGFLESLPGANFVNKYLGGDWLNKQLGFGGDGKPMPTDPKGFDRTPGRAPPASSAPSGGAAPPTSGASSASAASNKGGGKDTPSAGRINWRQYLGVNRSPGQYDCSSFVQMVMKRAFGINLPRTSEAQFNGGRAVTSLQEGDLVFWNGHNRFAPPGHVGIYIGQGMVMHDHGMSDTADVVPLRSMASLGYMGARRYVDVKSGAPLPSEGGKPKGPPTVGGFSVVRGGAITGGGGTGGGFIGAGNAAIATAESVRTGTVQTSLVIPGLGKVLVGTEQKPTVDAIDKQIQELIKKGRAAVSRRTAKQKALGKLLRIKSRVGRAARQKMINRLRADIKKLTILINDIREELGALYSTRQDLVDEMASDAEAAAKEAEGAAGAADDSAPADVAGAPVDITAIPAETRLGLLQAGETASQSDDLFFLKQEESLFAGRLANTRDLEQRIELTQALQGVQQQIYGVLTSTPVDLRLAQARAAGTPTGADDAAVAQQTLDLVKSRVSELEAMQQTVSVQEALISLIGQRNSLEDQLKQTLAAENAELISYLTNLRDLRNQFAGNIYTPVGQTGRITLNNFFGATPADPHLFSSQVAFDLGALVG